MGVTNSQNMAYAIFWLFISLLRFLAYAFFLVYLLHYCDFFTYFWPKNRSNEINSPKNALWSRKQSFIFSMTSDIRECFFMYIRMIHCTYKYFVSTALVKSPFSLPTTTFFYKCIGWIPFSFIRLRSIAVKCYIA